MNGDHERGAHYPLLSRDDFTFLSLRLSPVSFSLLEVLVCLILYLYIFVPLLFTFCLRSCIALPARLLADNGVSLASLASHTHYAYLMTEIDICIHTYIARNTCVNRLFESVFFYLLFC